MLTTFVTSSTFVLFSCVFYSISLLIYFNSLQSRFNVRMFCFVIREIRIRIYLPFLPDKVMTDLLCWEWQSSSIWACFKLVAHSWTQKHVTWHSGFSSECLLSISRAQHLNGLLTALKWYHTQQCKTILCPTILKGSKSLKTVFKSVSCKIFE
jgi:hypothetical protein